MLKLQVAEDTDRLKKRERCLRYLREHKVDVGLTSTASARSKFLLGIHTRGSPIMRIPPRPVVQPALAQEGLRAEMGEKLLVSWRGRHPGIHRRRDLAAQQPGDPLRRLDLQPGGEKGRHGERKSRRQAYARHRRTVQRF